MSTDTFRVDGMTCAHCATAVTRELERIVGVQSVSVDVTAGTVEVTAAHTPDLSAVAAAVDEAGYTLVGAK